MDDKAMITARRLVESHIQDYGMVPHPDKLKEAIARELAPAHDMNNLAERLRNFRVWNNRQSRYEPVPVCQEAAEALQRKAQQPTLVTDWEDVEQLNNVTPWCEACQAKHWAGQCDPDLDQQRGV